MRSLQGEWPTAGRVMARVALVLALAMASLLACARVATGPRDAAAPERAAASPTAPGNEAAALGTLRPASRGWMQDRSLAAILLGTSTAARALAFDWPAKPTAVCAAADGDLYFIDFAGGLLLRWNAADGTLSQVDPAALSGWPVAVASSPEGGLIVGTVGDTDGGDGDDGGTIVAVSSDGQIVRTFEAPARNGGDGATAALLCVGGIACVGDEVWVSNIAAHGVDVFDRATGRWRRRVGRRGGAAGEFRFPMGLAGSPDGRVYVVDSMNSRVQVFDRGGVWQRTIGRAGDGPGCFSRPRDVCIGPDGTVFVSDAAAGRVQAFDGDGRFVATLGADESGGTGSRLIAPGGVAAVTSLPGRAASPPESFASAYYVVVAERLNEPGLRAFAWGRSGDDTRRYGAATRAEPPPEWSAPLVEGVPRAVNPHWSAAHCGQCHVNDAESPAAISMVAADRLCLSCHDGRQAHDEPHPTGRLAVTATVRTPADWPTDAGRLTCLTCHDIRQHCDAGAARPAANPAMLRGHEPERADAYCRTCHVADESWRFSPHRTLAADGAVDSRTCLFCHVEAPAIPPDGVRRGEAMLRSASSQACLACHVRHWDVSQRGHVDRPVPTAIRRFMMSREAALIDGAASGGEAKSSGESPSPQRLPLGDGRVTCYSCHNPHGPGLFPPASDLGRRAESPIDAAASLRVDSATLCLECHEK